MLLVSLTILLGRRAFFSDPTVLRNRERSFKAYPLT